LGEERAGVFSPVSRFPSILSAKKRGIIITFAKSLEGKAKGFGKMLPGVPPVKTPGLLS